MLEAVLSKISKSDKSRSSSREWHWGPWMPLCVIHREKPPQEVQMLIPFTARVLGTKVVGCFNRIDNMSSRKRRLIQVQKEKKKSCYGLED